MKLYRLTWNKDFPGKQMTEDFKQFPELKYGMTMRVETVGRQSFHVMYLIPLPGREAQLEMAAQKWVPDSVGWVEHDSSIFVIHGSILNLKSSEAVVGPSLA